VPTTNLPLSLIACKRGVNSAVGWLAQAANKSAKIISDKKDFDFIIIFSLR